MSQTVLLVDDSSVDRTIYQRFLSQDDRQSYEIVEFEAGEAALEWCQGHQADVIVLDYMLPQMDGLEFLRRLGQQHPDEILPVILLTGFGNTAVAVEALKLGAQDYLEKEHLTQENLSQLVRGVAQQVQLKRKLLRQQTHQRVVDKIALRMRQSLDSQRMLEEATQAIRQFLQVDRVLVYQFAPDWSGSIVAESVGAGWPIALNQQIQDTCFQQGAGSAYLQGHTWAIGDIAKANLTDCHRALLEQFSVKANLVVPVLSYVAEQTEQAFSPSLWGLLITHQCAAPYHWQAEEIQFLQQVAVHLSGAMQQISLYQQAQLELQYRRRAESRFQQLADQSPFAIHIVDPDGTIRYVNQAWEALWQVPEDQVLGVHLLSHPYMKASGITAYVEQALAGEIADPPPFYFDPAELGHQGRPRWINLTLYPMKNEQGEIQEIVGVIQDYTDQKQAERSLQESEERLRLLIKHSPVSLAMFDREMRYIMASQRWINDHDREGRSIEDYLGRSHYEIYPDIPERWRQAHQQGLAGAIEKCDEDLFVRSQGQPQWVRWEIRPWYSADEEIGGIVIFSEEITGRKQSEIKLAESESRLRLAQAASKSGVWDWDLVTNSLCWSPEYYQLYGLDLNIEPDYETWLSCVHPDDREQANRKTLQAANDPNGELRVEFRVISAEPIRWFAGIGQVLCNEAGEPIRFIGISIDITELKQVQESLRQSNEQLQGLNRDLERANHAKDAFLRMMSHELRTPLNPILGMAEALEEEVFGSLNDRQKRAVSKIADQGQHLLELVNNILDLVNLEASKISLNRYSVRVSDLCRASLAAITPQAGAKTIQLQTEISPEVSVIYIDGERIKQVLIQLLENAVKFTPAGGTVNLQVQKCPIESSLHSSESSYVQFSIRDTGIGIAPENLQHLFQFFTQIDDRLSRDYAGIGIGLALVQCLTELHQGHLTVESQLGQGSCFTVSIPCSKIETT